ncbi:fused MFS/spermidine synthase [Candidatus Gottesmanbacteria bacterium]|nr:fused MFS/spermidine synthase [Candidatus Gottesmanbacteria bacterium]
MEYKKILSYLGTPYIIYKTRSKYNGEILVNSVFGQNSISVGNLTQTGSIVSGLWSFAVKQIENVNSCLVLGVGGGSIIKVLRNKYPHAEITGVEIDKTMIDIGKKYFDLDKYEAKIVIADAFNYVSRISKKFDLICIDLLVGRTAPKKLSSETFFRNIKRLLSKDGIVIINQLRLKSQPENEGLLKILKRTFTIVEIKKPLVNTIIYLYS